MDKRRRAGFTGRVSTKTPQTIIFAGFPSRQHLRITAPGVPTVSSLEIRNKELKAIPAQSSLTGSLFWFPYERLAVP